MSSFAALKQQREARRAPRYGNASRPQPQPQRETTGAQQPDKEAGPENTAKTVGETLAAQTGHSPVASNEPVAGPSRLPDNHDLVVRQVEGKGRGIFWQPQGPSSAPLCRKGDILLQLRPVASALSTEELRRRCSYCFSKAQDVGVTGKTSTPSAAELMRCSACKVVKYCNVDCQRGDWPQHKDECKALRSFAKLRTEARARRKQEASRSKRSGAAEANSDDEMDLDGSTEDGGDSLTSEPGAVVRAMARLVWAKKKAGAGSSLAAQVDGLMSHRAQMSEEAAQRLAPVSMQLAHYLASSAATSLDELGTKQPGVLDDLDLGSAALLLELVCKFAANSFALTDSELDSIGVCIDPTTATLNHSCYPNAVVVFPFSGAAGTAAGRGRVSKSMHLVATRDIEAGEEVQVAYVDVSDRFVDRQRALKERYHFDCRCDLCRRTLKQAQPPSATQTAKSRWRDPREAMWCPTRCGGWVTRPGAAGDSAPSTIASTPSVCNKCKKAAQLDTSSIAEETRRGYETAREAQQLSQTGDAAAAWQICSKVLGQLVDRYPPSSQPLFSLLRISVTALIDLGHSSLPPAAAEAAGRGSFASWPADVKATAYFFEEATRLAMLLAAGCQATTVAPSVAAGPIYGEGHPARAVALATLGKLALVEIQQPAARSVAPDGPAGSPPAGQSGAVRHVERTSRLPSVLSNPPVLPAEARLSVAKQALTQALRELEVGFGRSNGGGAMGQQVRQTLSELEREEAIVSQAMREGRGIAV